MIKIEGSRFIKLYFVCLLILCNHFLLGQPEGYTLVWSDEFNGTELDTSKWKHRALGPRRKAINVKEAVKLDGEGNLLLVCTNVDTNYHVGMIGTEYTFQTKYGYFECRVKFQREEGHWTAFWLQSPTINNIGNPAKNGAEINIFEFLSRENDWIHQNIYWDGYGPEIKSDRKILVIPDISNGYHKFALEWTDSLYIFYVDDIETWRSSKGVSQRSEYMILSDEVDDWGGKIENALLPDTIFFDYVRVYKYITASKNELLEKGIDIFPNPVKDDINIIFYDKKIIEISLFRIDGKEIKKIKKDNFHGKDRIVMNLFDIDSGLYIIKVNTDVGCFSDKILVIN